MLNLCRLRALMCSHNFFFNLPEKKVQQIKAVWIFKHCLHAGQVKVGPSQELSVNVFSVPTGGTKKTPPVRSVSQRLIFPTDPPENSGLYTGRLVKLKTPKAFRCSPDIVESKKNAPQMDFNAQHSTCACNAVYTVH